MRAPSPSTVGDLVGEALRSIIRRPGRSALTGLSIVLGVGTFITTSGLASVTRARVDDRFNALRSTEVLVQDGGGGSSTLGARSESVALGLPGVLGAGRWWSVDREGLPIATQPPGAPAMAHVPVRATTPRALGAIGASASYGRLFSEFDEKSATRGVLLGAAVAKQLGLPLTSVVDGPTIWLDGNAFTLLGIIDDVDRRPDALLAAHVPTATAQAMWGPPSSVSLLLHVSSGAADQVATQVPFALAPEDPDRISALVPPNPHKLRASVAGDVSSLALMIAVIALVLGAMGIANTTLVSVIERRGEIGLRRALGARRWHIAGQFLAESSVLGTLGGLLGAIGGTGVVVASAAVQHAPLVLDPRTIVPAPLFGGAIGLLAGGYPALRAATIHPIEALRR